MEHIIITLLTLHLRGEGCGSEQIQAITEFSSCWSIVPLIVLCRRSLLRWITVLFAACSPTTKDIQYQVLSETSRISRFLQICSVFPRKIRSGMYMFNRPW